MFHFSLMYSNKYNCFKNRCTATTGNFTGRMGYFSELLFQILHMQALVTTSCLFWNSLILVIRSFQGKRLLFKNKSISSIEQEGCLIKFRWTMPGTIKFYHNLLVRTFWIVPISGCYLVCSMVRCVTPKQFFHKSNLLCNSWYSEIVLKL